MNISLITDHIHTLLKRLETPEPGADVWRENVATELKALNDALGLLNEDPASLPADQEIALLLHQKQCSLDHAETCDWYFESWNSNTNSARNKYLFQAQKLINEVGYRVAKDVVELL